MEIRKELKEARHFVDRALSMVGINQMTGEKTRESHMQRGRYTDAMDPKMAAALATAAQVVEGISILPRPASS